MEQKENEYYFEWRKISSSSLLLPPIKYNTAGTIINEDIYIFGGKGSSSQFNEIWKYSTNKLEWELIEIRGNEIPLPRDGHTLTKINNNKFIVFGGQGHLLDSGICERGTENGKVKYISMKKLFDDMYEFDCQSKTWLALPRRKIRPIARRGHSLLYLKPLTQIKGIESHPDDILLGSSGKGHLLLFGGSCLDLSTGFEKPANDVWLYCLEHQTWEEVHCDGQIPPPVYGHCAQIVDNMLIVVGGTVLSLKTNKGFEKQKAGKKKNRVDDLNQSLVSTFSNVQPENSTTTHNNNSNNNNGGSGNSSNSNNNNIYVLDLTTMIWTQVLIDIKSEIPNGKSIGLNLIGHSLVPSPVDSKELFIFGGRKSDENLSSSSSSSSSSFNNIHNNGNNNRNSKTAKASSNIFVINLETLVLSELPISNPFNDNVNIPEPRLNQLLLRRSEQMIQFKPPVVEEKPPKKGKGSRRAPPLPVKRPKLLPHPVISLFGGSKLYSSGFCSGSMYDLYFVPIEKKESNWVEQVEALIETPEQESKKDNTDDNISTRLTICSSSVSRKMSAMQLIVETQSDPNEIFHMLNIKDNSSTKLLSPKRGIGAQYFTLKTHLSRSRSTFSRPGTSNNNNNNNNSIGLGNSFSTSNIMNCTTINNNNNNSNNNSNMNTSRLNSPPSPALPDIRSRRPASAPSTSLFTTSKNELTNLNDSNIHEEQGMGTHLTPPDSPSQIRKKINPFEKIKTMSNELCPLVKGMSVHEARLVFNQLHPLNSSS